MFELAKVTRACKKDEDFVAMKKGETNFLKWLFHFQQKDMTKGTKGAATAKCTLIQGSEHLQINRHQLLLNVPLKYSVLGLTHFWAEIKEPAVFSVFFFTSN